MARDRTPIVKRSRREGVALHPKAHKIMLKRKNPPGFSPTMRRRKLTQYGIQLREKQKVKRHYGLLEKPFRRLVKEAGRTAGISGETLLQLLERRIDNVVYRAGLAPSRRAARQLVTHGHLMLNEHRVNVPSIRVKAGDAIKPRVGSAKNHYFTDLKAETDKKPNLPSWIALDIKKLEIKVTGLPVRDDAEPDINESLIIEFYSR